MVAVGVGMGSIKQTVFSDPVVRVCAQPQRVMGRPVNLAVRFEFVIRQLGPSARMGNGGKELARIEHVVGLLRTAEMVGGCPKYLVHLSSFPQKGPMVRGGKINWGLRNQHGALQIKNPPYHSGMEGCTQFTWPHISNAPAWERLDLTTVPAALPYLRGNHVKAGLLAPGSSEVLHLPNPLLQESGLSQISSPVTAAGPLPNSTGFPIKPCGTLMSYLTKHRIEYKTK